MDTGVSRRRFLRGSLLASALIGGGLLIGRCAMMGPGSGSRYLGVGAGLRCLSEKEYLVLHAVAARILAGAAPPVGASLVAGGGGGGSTIIDVARWADGYVAQLHEVLRDDFRGLLQLVEHSALVAGRRGRFTALPAEAQDAVLQDWQRSRITLRRKGFQALKALCCLAYYQDERSFAGIGYSGPLVQG